jgi:hypothetical protein
MSMFIVGAGGGVEEAIILRLSEASYSPGVRVAFLRR